MEELRTIEILDLEIMEDAQGKASSILKTADDTLKAQSREREKRTQEALDSVRKDYAERTKRIHGEIFARFPLDKQRLRIEFTETLLLKAMDDFLRSLAREKLLSILELRLSERLKTCSGSIEPGEAEVSYSGMDLSEARQLLEKTMNKPAGLLKDTALKEDTLVHEFPSIVINTKALRITASVEAAAVALLKEKRAELACALLGEGVLND